MTTNPRKHHDFLFKRIKPAIGFMPLEGVKNIDCLCGRIAYKVPGKPWVCGCIEPSTVDGVPLNEIVTKNYHIKESPVDKNLTLNLEKAMDGIPPLPLPNPTEPEQEKIDYSKPSLDDLKDYPKPI